MYAAAACLQPTQCVAGDMGKSCAQGGKKGWLGTSADRVLASY